MNLIELIVLVAIIGGFGLVGLVGVANDVHCTYKDLCIKFNRFKRDIKSRFRIWRATR